MPRITKIGRTSGRRVQEFGMYEHDRLSHLYIVGQTGVGKTSLLQSMIEQDIARGHGVILLDPHGDLASRLLKNLKPNQAPIYIDIADPECPYGFNPVQGVNPPLVPLVVAGMMDSMRNLFADAWGSRMEGVLRVALYAVVEAGDGTISDVLRILHDNDYRKALALRLSNQEVRRYWLDEFPDINPRFRAEMILPIQTKISALLCDPRLQALFTRKGNVLRFRKLMDEGKTVIINLSKGKLGADSAGLVGSLMLTAITMAALSRATVAENQRRIVWVYMDEAHLLTTETVAEMVAELRKYGIGLVMANQQTAQFGENVRRAVLGNVGSLIVFRAALDDATYFSKSFGYDLLPRDFLNLATRNAYAKILVDGEPTRPFSMTTLPVE